MARIRLTDEEREQRRKERVAFSLSDAAYKHYDPKIEGYGSAAQWTRLAEELIGKVAPGATLGAAPKRKTMNDEDLEVMGLSEAPGAFAGLKKAFRNMLFVAHPDHGGTSEATRKLVEAFERLSKLYK